MTLDDWLAWGVPQALCIPSETLAMVFFASHLLMGIAYLLIPPGVDAMRAFVPGTKLIDTIWRRFSRFILLCGITHLVAAMTLYVPIYSLEVLGLVVTAAYSAFVAVTFIVYVRPAIIDLLGVLQTFEQIGDMQQDLERHRTSFQDAPIGIIHVNYEGAIVEANKLFAQWLKADLQWLQGRKFLDFVHPDDVERTSEMFKSHGQEGGQLEANFQNRWIARDGTVIRLLWQPSTGVAVGNHALVAWCTLLQAEGLEPPAVSL